MSANQQAFQAELSRARQARRGDIFRGTASFECLNERCSVRLVRIGFVEERGGPALTFQWPLLCSRCRQPFERYVGQERGR
jgi:hypothetical protein